MTKVLVVFAAAMSNFIPEAWMTIRAFPWMIRGEIEVELYAWGVEHAFGSFVSSWFLAAELLLFLLFFRIVATKAKGFRGAFNFIKRASQN